jgi:hypothetical protein
MTPNPSLKRKAEHPGYGRRQKPNPRVEFPNLYYGDRDGNRPPGNSMASEPAYSAPHIIPRALELPYLPPMDVGRIHGHELREIEPARQNEFVPTPKLPGSRPAYPSPQSPRFVQDGYPTYSQALLSPTMLATEPHGRTHLQGLDQLPPFHLLQTPTRLNELPRRSSGYSPVDNSEVFGRAKVVGSSYGSTVEDIFTNARPDIAPDVADMARARVVSNQSHGRNPPPLHGLGVGQGDAAPLHAAPEQDHTTSSIINHEVAPRPVSKPMAPTESAVVQVVQQTHVDLTMDSYVCRISCLANHLQI